MSDQWRFFPCQMGEHRASIFYDHGILDTIDSIAPLHLLKVRVAFKQPRSDGMPAKEEFQSLTTFEDALQALVEQHESLYVGRVTVDGHRHFYIYTPDPEQAWSTQLRKLGVSHCYAVSFAVQPDASRDGYWKELFPTEDDWQVIKDLGVIEALQKEGDDGTASRQIDHWAYFPSHDTAAQFCQWLRERGYNLDSGNAVDDGKISVRFRHEGTVQLADITSHTVALQRKARELGGDYDGWETPVCKRTD